MKKLIASIILAAIVLSMAACGGDSADTSTVTTTETVTDTVAESDESDTEATTASDTDAETTDVSVTTEATTIDPETDEPDIVEPIEGFDNSGIIEETVLVDKDGIKIIAEKIIYEDSLFELKLNLENNTDQDITIYAGLLGFGCNSINGYMVSSGYFSQEITAGKKAVENVSFYYKNLRLYGITSLAELELCFEVRDADNNDLFETSAVIKTSLAESYDYSESTFYKAINSKAVCEEHNITNRYSTNEMLYNKEGIKILSVAAVETKDGNTRLYVEVQNTGTEAVKVNFNDFEINGLTVASSDSFETVYAGKRMVLEVELEYKLSAAEREIYGIKEIGSVAFDVVLNDNKLTDPETIRITIDGADASFDATGEEIYNNDGIIIRSKGVFDSESDYDDDIEFRFIVMNNTSDVIKAYVTYDSVSVNGYMVQSHKYTNDIRPDGAAELVIVVYASSLEDADVSGVGDVTDLEFDLVISDASDREIDEKSIELDF